MQLDYVSHNGVWRMPTRGEVAFATIMAWVMIGVAYAYLAWLQVDYMCRRAKRLVKG